MARDSLGAVVFVAFDDDDAGPVPGKPKRSFRCLVLSLSRLLLHRASPTTILPFPIAKAFVASPSECEKFYGSFLARKEQHVRAIGSTSEQGKAHVPKTALELKPEQHLRQERLCLPEKVSGPANKLVADAIRFPVSRKALATSTRSRAAAAPSNSTATVAIDDQASIMGAASTSPAAAVPSPSLTLQPKEDASTQATQTLQSIVVLGEAGWENDARVSIASGSTEYAKLGADLARFHDTLPTPFHTAAAVVKALSQQGFAAAPTTSSPRQFVALNPSTVLAWVRPQNNTSTRWRVLLAGAEMPHLELSSVNFALRPRGPAPILTFIGSVLQVAGMFSLEEGKEKSSNNGSGKTAAAGLDSSSPKLQNFLYRLPELRLHMNGSLALELGTTTTAEAVESMQTSMRQLARQHYHQRQENFGGMDTMDEVKICLADSQPAQRVGVDQQRLAGYRMASVAPLYAALQACLQTSSETVSHGTAVLFTTVGV